MKRTGIAIVSSLLCLAIPVFAQHGRGGMGGGTSMGGGMSSGMGHRSNVSTQGSANASGSHGQRTMDQKLSTNTQLAGKISTLTGMSALQACSGFKNLGQCMAAAHVSKNLGIPFANLKDTMLGLNADGTASTTAKPMSLGKAISTLDPQVNAKAEVKKANQQSSQDQSTSDSSSGS